MDLQLLLKFINFHNNCYILIFIVIYQSGMVVIYDLHQQSVYLQRCWSPRQPQFLMGQKMAYG